MNPDICPVPRPDNDLARDLPDGGWEARLPDRERLPTITYEATNGRCCAAVALTVRRPWACTQDQHPDSPWHIATVLGGVVVAVWAREVPDAAPSS